MIAFPTPHHRSFRSLPFLGRAVVLVLGLMSTAACSEVVLADGSSDPGSFVSVPTSLQLVCGLDIDCVHFMERRRHQARTERALDQLRLEQEHHGRLAEAQYEQARATMLAAGLDPDQGQGFWCYSGEYRGQPLGECRRTLDECADQFQRRARSGFSAHEARCSRQAEAACFRATRTLEEGERAMCFDQVSTCQRIQAQVDAEGFVSAPDECSVDR